MKKEGGLDRFERTALNWWLKDLPEIDGPIIRSGIVKLLRKEHAWVRRMVNKVNVWACQESMDNEDVIVVILRQLAQRRK